jgi:4'-phosphopantetheinyl transferase
MVDLFHSLNGCAAVTFDRQFQSHPFQPGASLHYDHQCGRGPLPFPVSNERGERLPFSVPLAKGYSVTMRPFHPTPSNSAVSTLPNLPCCDLVNGSNIVWPSCPPGLPLRSKQIQVWAVSLDVDPKGLANSLTTLSIDERERANRFRFDMHRNRFIAGRGALRAILSQYLDCMPGQLKFAYGPNGKPALLETGHEIQFNLAHSENLALLAVVRNVDVGVDIELVRPIHNVEQLVERFFSPSENALFQNLAEPERPAAFFKLWTR